MIVLNEKKRLERKAQEDARKESGAAGYCWIKNHNSTTTCSGFNWLRIGCKPIT
jgi:hypothetical protein